MSNLKFSGNLELLKSLGSKAKLSAGDNIQLEDGVISTVDTPSFSDVMINNESLTNLLEHKYDVKNGVEINENQIVLNSGVVTGLAHPVNDSDAVSKNYLDKQWMDLFEHLKTYNIMSYQGAYDENKTYNLGDLVYDSEMDGDVFYLSNIDLNNEPLANFRAWKKINIPLGLDGYVTGAELDHVLKSYTPWTQHVQLTNNMQQTFSDVDENIKSLRMNQTGMNGELEELKQRIAKLEQGGNNNKIIPFLLVKIIHTNGAVYYTFYDNESNPIDVQNMRSDSNIFYSVKIGVFDQYGTTQILNKNSIWNVGHAPGGRFDYNTKWQGYQNSYNDVWLTFNLSFNLPNNRVKRYRGTWHDVLLPYSDFPNLPSQSTWIVLADD